MAFERFIRQTRTITPLLSVYRNGTLNIGTPAVKKWPMAAYKFAVLFWNEDLQQIGLFLTNDDTEVGITMLTKTTSGGLTVSARAFLEHYAIPFRTNQRYEITYNTSLELYIADLRKPYGLKKRRKATAEDHVSG